MDVSLFLQFEPARRLYPSPQILNRTLIFTLKSSGPSNVARFNARMVAFRQRKVFPFRTEISQIARKSPARFKPRAGAREHSGCVQNKASKALLFRDRQISKVEHAGNHFAVNQGHRP